MSKKLKKGEIELRYRRDNPEELDEIVGFGVDYIHFEVMSDQAIWGCIEAKGRRVDVWFQSKNGKSHIKYDVTSDYTEPKKSRGKK